MSLTLSPRWSSNVACAQPILALVPEVTLIHEALLFGKTSILNRSRCELKASQHLYKFSVCNRGSVPAFYGYIDRFDPSTFDPPLHNFSRDKLRLRAILLEYLLVCLGV